MQRQSVLPLIVACAVFACSAAATPAQMKTFWPDPVANEIVPYSTGGLTPGPILGRPTSTARRVWIRTAQPMPFRVVYDTKLPLSANAPAVEGETIAEADNTGFVDLTGLKPNTQPRAHAVR